MPSKFPSLHSFPNRRPKSCPLCKQAGRNDQHFLSKCSFLPPEDRRYLTKTRLATIDDDDDDDSDNLDEYTAELGGNDAASFPSARIISRRVSTRQYPLLSAFYRQHPLQITLDTGAETSTMKASLAC